MIIADIVNILAVIVSPVISAIAAVVAIVVAIVIPRKQKQQASDLETRQRDFQSELETRQERFEVQQTADQREWQRELTDRQVAQEREHERKQYFLATAATLRSHLIQWHDSLMQLMRTNPTYQRIKDFDANRYYEDHLTTYLNELQIFPENERGDIVLKAEQFHDIARAIKERDERHLSALTDAYQKAIDEIVCMSDNMRSILW